MIECRAYRDGVLREEAFDPARAKEILDQKGSRVWLDLAEPTAEELALIQREFDLHPLVIEDLEHRGQRAKLEVYDRYYFMTIHGLSLSDDGELVDHEVHLVSSERFLVTVRFPPAFDLSEAIRRWDRQPELTAEGAGFLAYAVLDEIVDGYFDVVDLFEDRSEEIEDRVFADEPDRTVQRDIFRLKRKVVQFRRLVGPLRPAMDRLIEEARFVAPGLLPYFRDVSDHVIRVLEFTDNLRELLTASLEAQLSQVSNRLNQIMKQVASWSAIILLPTLIAGIYGMNFDHMPELHWLAGYPLALGLMAVAAGLLYRMFRRRDWL
jgi:magnesium transporter